MGFVEAIAVRSALAVVLAVGGLAAHAQVNPAARPARDVTALAGAWNGSHLEQRSACRNVQNSGFHGTYSEYSMYVDPVGHSLVITEAGVTGLTCTWSGQYRDDASQASVSGTVSCSDGRTGDFQTQGFYVMATLMSIRLNVQLTGSESCVIDAILAGARF
jgi:hypothetical protein